ncbi:glycoside hydrolase family 27 protein [Amycolatopsis sp. MtRt-6]|uniref:glycoside hydrolase family 27 protein n=1 Tax=Amycolatopsis sp. MtRt-6 TaxID=2792782 RepID=UPI0027DB997F|nr:glycoside hydrolase family 27 protein [Amycolatopsis sp. MtRt-6]
MRLDHGIAAKQKTSPLVLLLVVLTWLLSLPTAAPALANGLAGTPPMGWNSWNQVRCHDLTEDVVRKAADALADTGLRDAGYQYVVVDDCWQAPTRAADGSLRADPTRFPHGIAELADYVHSRGLLFGIYAVPGSRTCAMANDAYPASGIGSLGHERQDAETFDRWGVDYLKYDWCNADTVDGLDRKAAFEKMRDELAALPRPIVYAISEYGVSSPWTWARPVANLWRTTNDLVATWDSVLATIDQQAAVAVHSGSPGGWNDPDMLQVGNGTLTADESRAHFSVWAVLNAPLFAGTDPAKLSDADLATLGNAEAIAVDQDFAGGQGRRLDAGPGYQVGGTPGGEGGSGVVLQTPATPPATVSASIPGSWNVRDLWAHRDVGTDVSATLRPHQAALLKLTPR